jgi:hypothetical protein
MINLIEFAKACEEVKKDFQFFHYPKGAKKAVPVQVKGLAKVIGANNANTAVLKALRSKLDKETIRFRKRGSVYIYRK